MGELNVTVEALDPEAANILLATEVKATVEEEDDDGEVIQKAELVGSKDLVLELLDAYFRSVGAIVNNAKADGKDVTADYAGPWQ